jgi:hypothetical protein
MVNKAVVCGQLARGEVLTVTGLDRAGPLHARPVEHFCRAPIPSSRHQPPRKGGGFAEAQAPGGLKADEPYLPWHKAETSPTLSS